MAAPNFDAALLPAQLAPPLQPAVAWGQAPPQPAAQVPVPLPPAPPLQPAVAWGQAQQQPAAQVPVPLPPNGQEVRP
jgi:hypothetical protein